MPITTTLMEVAIAVHFNGPLSLSVLDLASWVEAFSDFETLQELPPNPQIELQPQATFQIGPQVSLPRLIKRKGSGAWVQFQADRFAMGWRRTEPLGTAVDYPGFPALRGEWQDLSERFFVWHSTRLGGRPPLRLAELSYTNQAPRQINGQPVRISEILRFYRNESGRGVNAFQINWTELLEKNLEAARVNAQFSAVSLATGEPIFHFAFLGVSPVPPSSGDVLGALDALHSRIIDMYQAAIISANYPG